MDKILAVLSLYLSAPTGVILSAFFQELPWQLAGLIINLT